MHKAYDLVEWVFLKEIMLRLGFQESWVNFIMQCVSTVEYRVRFNLEETESFKPSRGLRQGDPLSPYLFLLCTEGLCTLLSHAEESAKIEGAKVCREAPPITNLLFADDSLILMQASIHNAEALKTILDSYCKASGQLTSVDKSSIFFSTNIKVEIKEQLCTTLNIMTEALNDKYLGLPANVGMDKSDCFQYLIDRVIMKISGWKEKLLSAGGKEILLKSVVQAIPTYAMSVFKIPKKNCKGIIDAMAHFWWGDEENQRRMHWMAWWKMCIPKNQGGMGFRDIHCFNLALLAKQAWRLLDNPDSLCATILRAKYYPDGDLLNSKQKKGSSFTSQSIMAGINSLKHGYIWRVGNGQNINIWEDACIPNFDARKVVTPRGGTTVN